MKKWLKTAACVTALALCVIMGLKESVKFQGLEDKWNYICEPGISAETAEEALNLAASDEDLTDMVFWTQKNNQTVSARIPTAKETTADIILISGNPQILLENYNVPQNGDSGGCLIGKDTAYQLFGSTEVTGMYVSYGGREYEILGVTEELKSVLVIQTPPGSNETFTRITAQNRETTTSCNLKNTLQNKCGIAAEEIRWLFLRGIVKLIFCAAVLAVYFRMIQTRRTSRLVAGFLLLAFLLKITGLTQIPAEFIPAKWSDFGFYGEVLDTFAQGLMSFLKMPLYAPELKWLMNCVSLSVWIVLGGASCVPVIQYVKTNIAARLTQTHAELTRYMFLAYPGRNGTRIFCIRRTHRNTGGYSTLTGQHSDELSVNYD